MGEILPPAAVSQRPPSETAPSDALEAPGPVPTPEPDVAPKPDRPDNIVAFPGVDTSPCTACGSPQPRRSDLMARRGMAAVNSDKGSPFHVHHNSSHHD